MRLRSGCVNHVLKRVSLPAGSSAVASSAADEAGLAVEFGNARIGVPRRAELAADLALIVVSTIVSMTPALPVEEFAQGSGWPAILWMSAEVTALRTVISSESVSVLGGVCGTVPVATERSTFESLRKSKPPVMQPESGSIAAPTTNNMAQRHSRPFVWRFDFAMTSTLRPVQS
ncbi:hypothetical protein AJ87_23215 [Rhizobium yanglingense]|nr:hypothetical protein AJ87_23215 [Rhizobium yanglingense]